VHAHFRVSARDRVVPSAPTAVALYAVAAVVLTWPLAPRAARDVPGDLLDPLFSCWTLGWNFHALGVSPGGPPATGYWDANIFHPVRGTLALSEHFVPQALQGALVYAATGNLVLTYNVLFLATFVLSGAFMFLLARDETGDPGAALGAGFLYAFALVRWTQVEADDAVLAVFPFGEILHEARAMFDSTAHWRRMLNGYSSWMPRQYSAVAYAVRDPLRRAPEVMAALRGAGATHVVVHEAGWARDRGRRVTERLIAAGARPLARAGDVALLGVGPGAGEAATPADRSASAPENPTR
jgi:hypothetical protein